MVYKFGLVIKKIQKNTFSTCPTPSEFMASVLSGGSEGLNSMVPSFSLASGAETMTFDP